MTQQSDARLTIPDSPFDRKSEDEESTPIEQVHLTTFNNNNYSSRQPTFLNSDIHRLSPSGKSDDDDYRQHHHHHRRHPKHRLVVVHSPTHNNIIRSPSGRSEDELDFGTSVDPLCALPGEVPMTEVSTAREEV